MSMSKPLLIALDWGTSSLRAYALGEGGALLATRRSPHGIMNLPAAPDAAASAPHPQAGFERALQSVCGDWLSPHAQVPLLACGMVGSAQGWAEAGYLSLPLAPSDIVTGFVRVDRSPTGADLLIVPGLIQHGECPNVMRGEETQVAGVVAAMVAQGPCPERWLIGLPGTHSKWVWMEGQRITRFETFMTGEVFAALRHHTLLGRTMTEAASHDAQAFERGLCVSRSSQAPLGLLSHIFSTRTLGLVGQLPPSSQADYLSGVLIGHEVSAVSRAWADALGPVVLCGDPGLCALYATALQVHGHAAPQRYTDVTPQGLWLMAQAAGVVSQGGDPSFQERTP